MPSSSSPTTFSDLQPHILQTHILLRLDGPSLATVATASSYLHTLCTDHNLWTHICNSTWPSINHPRLHDVISTFPSGHRSFFQDSFPALITTNINHHHCSTSQPDSWPWPSELISAVDIHYHNDTVFSTVEFTDTCATDFQSSELCIVLKSRSVSGISRSIGLKIGELVDADDETITHLKESITLNWILIDPILKRAGNLSGIKPVLAWISNSNDIHLRYVYVLPGNEKNEMVECRIEVTLVVGKGGVGLQVSEVKLHVQDIVCNCLSGKEFLVITRRAILEKRNTKRKVVGFEDGDGMKLVGVKVEENKWVGYIIPFVSILLVVYIIFSLI